MDSIRAIFIRHWPALVGGMLVALTGCALGSLSLAESWALASYDNLFRFGHRQVTNQVALILMDNASYDRLGQKRGQAWSRQKHAELLTKLTGDGCPLVVFDIFFAPDAPQSGDAALADAMRRHGRVALMAKVEETRHPSVEEVQVEPPEPRFLDAATNWGVAKVAANVSGTPRRHWRCPPPQSFPSLPETAARLAGATPPESPAEQWLRYYGCGRESPWETYSYHQALEKPTGHFTNKIVFIGNQPETSAVGDESQDEFATPYTRWTGEGVGGVEILATTFLNLVRGDWLQRPAPSIEAVVFVLAGTLLGGGLCRRRPLAASAAAAGAALGLTLTGAVLSYFTKYWFPWLVVVAGQIPLALAWALVARWRGLVAPGPAPTTLPPLPPTRIDEPVPADGLPVPVTPDYELFQPAIGSGGFGRVWRVRDQAGQLRALKAVYRAQFGSDSRAYETERRGVERYKPVSDQHPGLVQVEFLSGHRQEGYFYYVMQLADPVDPDWAGKGAKYEPLDLVNFCKQRPKNRLPVAEAARIILPLAEALQCLHDHGSVHRDVKPSNIIFVRQKPKLADVGCVGEARLPKDVTTFIGTRGYMPPEPEPPGTAQADVYALGKVLFVITTGNFATEFPLLSETLVEAADGPDFMRINPILLKACEKNLEDRYASAAAMADDLRKFLKEIRS